VEKRDLENEIGTAGLRYSWRKMDWRRHRTELDGDK